MKWTKVLRTGGIEATPLIRRYLQMPIDFLISFETNLEFN